MKLGLIDWFLYILMSSALNLNSDTFIEESFTNSISIIASSITFIVSLLASYSTGVIAIEQNLKPLYLYTLDIRTALLGKGSLSSAGLLNRFISE